MGVGWGDNWHIKIFNATNCEGRTREATLAVCVCVYVGGGGGGGLICFLKMKVIVALISVSSHPLYTVHTQNI